MTDKEKILAEIERLITDLGEQRDILLEELKDFINSLPEEPANIDFEQELYNHFGQVKDFTTGMRIARYFYEKGRSSQEPVSEDRKEAILKKAQELAKEVDLIKGYFPKTAIIAVACDMAEWCDAHPVKKPVSDDLEEAAIMHYKDVMEYEAKTGLKPAYMTSFKAGAKWQFEHQWVSVKDRLPIEEFDDGYTFVFVNIEIDEDTSRFDVDYIRNGKWELHPDMNITHWMPIPPIPNKED